jgi:hypothetical protein
VFLDVGTVNEGVSRAFAINQGGCGKGKVRTGPHNMIQSDPVVPNYDTLNPQVQGGLLMLIPMNFDAILTTPLK